MTINPRMFVLARESRGLSQSAVAKTTGMSQSKLCKIESGLLAPSQGDVTQLAESLRYPKAFFGRSDEIRLPGSDCIHFRKRATTLIGDRRKACAQINVYRMQIAALLRGVEVDSVCTFPRMDIDVFDGRAEEIARLVRHSWKIPPGPIESLAVVVENAGGIVFPCTFDTDSIDAMSQWIEGLPPVFFIDKRKPGDRMRFSLAHELGHVVMHVIPTSDREAEADRFAAEFLMPGEDIISEFARPIRLDALVDMKTRWRVSIQALVRRARDLGLISERQYRSLFTRISQLGWRKSEPLRLPPEKATVLPKIIEVYKCQLQMDTRQLGDFLAMHEDEFRQVYLAESNTSIRLLKKPERLDRPTRA